MSFFLVFFGFLFCFFFGCLLLLLRIVIVIVIVFFCCPVQHRLLVLVLFVRFFFVGVHGHYPRRLPRGGGGGAGRGHPSTRAPAFCGSRGALATCWNRHAGLARSPPKRVDRVITAQCATPNLLHTENSVRVWAVSRPRPSKSGSLPNENYSTPSGDPPSVNRKYCGGEERTNSLRQIPFVVLVGMCGS